VAVLALIAPIFYTTHFFKPLFDAIMSLSVPP
jgi:hypothetical protein